MWTEIHVLSVLCADPCRENPVREEIMTTGQGLLMLFCGLVFMVMFQFAQNQRKNKEDFIRRARKSFGKVPEREYAVEELERISHYYKNYRNRAAFYLDDLTWNDLGMEDIFLLINQTCSSVGEDYLYWLLRTPIEDEEELKERDSLIRWFQTHEEERLKLQYVYHQLGRMRKHSVSDYFLRMMDLPAQGNLKHIAVILAEIASVTLLFVNSGLGVLCLFSSVCYGIFSYYKEKGTVEPYFVCLTQVTGMLRLVDDLTGTGIGDLAKYFDELKRLKRECAVLQKGSRLICTNRATGSLEDAILDYVRILTHVDLIQFNCVQKKMVEKEREISRLLEIFGFLESMIAAASFRELLGAYCVPEFGGDSFDGRGVFFSAEYMYHPMLERPVANSVRAGAAAGHEILITGSNASGKSTFLKTVGICAVLAQTIMTVPAEAYHASFLKVYSSMAIKDDIGRSESYYLAEIKALKRILDAKKRGEPVLCLVDEVLRGTNTVERIAASAQVLGELCGDNILCFAATHDIELTYMLDRLYENYHFEEEISGGDICFDYRLRKGRATTRNAIRLLSLLGYPAGLVDAAEQSAHEFMEKGEWRCL